MSVLDAQPLGRADAHEMRESTQVVKYIHRVVRRVNIHESSDLPLQLSLSLYTRSRPV